MKCKDCKNLKNRSTYGQCYAHEDCKICKDSDDGCIMFESIVQTNGDRIRAMSNEKLAKFLEVHCSTPEKLWLDWLNRSAESER